MVNTGVISNIQHFSVGDGPGIRTTVFFQGCNLRCLWCHNPETIPRLPVLLFYKNLCTNCGSCTRVCPSGAHELLNAEHIFNLSSCRASGKCTETCPSGALKLSGKTMTLEEVFENICEDIEFYKATGGGVTFSGGEPLLQADFCVSLAEKCTSHGISVIIDTAGNVSYSEFEKLLPYKVHFFYDLKAATEEDYRTKTGGSFMLTVINLAKLVYDGAQVTVRIPIIPGFNDNTLYCQDLRKVLKETGIERVQLMPFHRTGSSKYKALDKTYAYEKMRSLPDESLTRLLKIFADDFDAGIDG
jgi:glycyl-radical enzyme activating protein